MIGWGRFLHCENWVSTNNTLEAVPSREVALNTITVDICCAVNGQTQNLHWGFLHYCEWFG